MPFGGIHPLIIWRSKMEAFLLIQLVILMIVALSSTPEQI